MTAEQRQRKIGRPKKVSGVLKARDTKTVPGALLPPRPALNLTERILGVESEEIPPPESKHQSLDADTDIQDSRRPNPLTKKMTDAFYGPGSARIVPPEQPKPSSWRMSSNGKYRIDTDIPIPRISYRSNRVMPFRELEVRESFFAATTGKTATKVNNHLKGLEGRHYISRLSVEDGVRGRRIWRTK